MAIKRLIPHRKINFAIIENLLSNSKAEILKWTWVIKIFNQICRTFTKSQTSCRKITIKASFRRTFLAWRNKTLYRIFTNNKPRISINRKRVIFLRFRNSLWHKSRRHLNLTTPCYIIPSRVKIITRCFSLASSLNLTVISIPTISHSNNHTNRNNPIYCNNMEDLLHNLIQLWNKINKIKDPRMNS